MPVMTLVNSLRLISPLPSESNNRNSTLMRNLDTSAKYENSNLAKVQQDQTLGDQGSVFDLQVNIETPVDAEAEKSPAQQSGQ